MGKIGVLADDIPQLFHDLESGQAGHIQIQKQDVGLELGEDRQYRMRVRSRPQNVKPACCNVLSSSRMFAGWSSTISTRPL